MSNQSDNIKWKSIAITPEDLAFIEFRGIQAKDFEQAMRVAFGNPPLESWYFRTSLQMMSDGYHR